MDKVNKEQNGILTGYFLNKNKKNILNMHDKILYEYEDFIGCEEQDILNVLEEYVQKNRELTKDYVIDLEKLFDLWRKTEK